MLQIAFCCSNSRGTMFDRREAEVTDLFQAREYAITTIRSLIASAPLKDWRHCRLHAQDRMGQEIFVMPFWSILTKPQLKTRLIAALTRAWQ